MGNMPVIKDLIVDMDAVHWKKVQRVTPWLIAKQPMPEREYLVPHERRWSTSPSRWPASSAGRASRTAWRWRSTPASSARPRWPRPTASSATRATTSSTSASTTSPRTRRASTTARTASSACEACPKDVNPMGQIMRLRRIAGSDQHIVDRNNGDRHEAGVHDADQATTGCCTRPSCCRAPTAATRGSASSHPAAGKELLSSLPVVIKGVLRRKISPKIAIFGHKIPKQRPERGAGDLRQGREPPAKRYELNLYVTGTTRTTSRARRRAASARARGETGRRRTPARDARRPRRRARA